MKEHPDNHREGKSQEERDRFILSNMGLVHALAHRLKGRGIEYEELVSAGCVGLPARGFRVLAAGSFVAPHTFSAKVGKGRPNGADLAAAAELARRALDKLSGAWEPPALPGNRPYRDFQRAPFYPEGGGSCTGCGVCARACPVEAIDPASPRETDGERCIRCLACVHACPTGSRKVEGAAFAATVAHLEDALTKVQRPPELFR